ncbi:MAG: PAS domain S-box protein [Candidatus Margulisbacteria bacterium]|nr:PAS domain S-box protein [Candidatus Margulisiibacteriota bacterium]
MRPQNQQKFTLEKNRMIKQLKIVIMTRFRLFLFLLVFSVFLRFGIPALLPQIVIGWWLVAASAIITLISFLHIQLREQVSSLNEITFNCFVQLIVSILGISALLHIGGGIISPYSFFFILPIMSAMMLMPGRIAVAYVTMGLIDICYVGLLLLEYYRVFPLFHVFPWAESLYDYPAWWMIFGTIIPLAFLVITYYAVQAGQSIANARQELEKEMVGEIENLKLQLDKKLDETNAELHQKNKELEASLAEQEAATTRISDNEFKFRSIFDSTTDIIGQIDKSGKIIDINNRVTDLGGYPKEYFIGKNISSLAKYFTLKSMALISVNFARRMLGEHIDPYEVEARTKDGRSKILTVSVLPLKFEHGHVVGELGILHDITDQKRSESLLALQRDLGISLSTVRTLNEALSQVLQYCLKIEGIDSGGIYLVNETTGELSPAIQQGLSGENLKEVAIVPINFQGKAIGSLKLASHSIQTVSPIIQQAIEAIAAMIGSVVARHKTEAIGRETENRYQLLFQHSPLGIFQYDDQLRIIDCNDKVVTMLNSSREKLINFDLNKVKDQRIIPALKAALAGQEGIYEGEYHSTTGTATTWSRLHSSPLYDTTGKITGGIVLIEDFNDRRKADEAIKEKIVELEDFHKLAVGRELKMIEYEKEVNALLKELGRPEKYTT